MGSRPGPIRELVISEIISLVFLAGCGGGGSEGPPQQDHTIITVTISPSTAAVDQGGTTSFSAFVTGSPNTTVNWSVREGAAGGSITGTGLYTAPNAAGSFHVVATSQADSTQSATVVVTVPAVNIFVQPDTISMTSGESTAFSVSVSGTVNTAVAWSVQEPSGGQVSALGKYTAPASFGIFHVVATSQADSSKSARATVTVAAVSVSVFPTSDLLGPQGVRRFSARVASALQQAVTWSVQEGAAGGSITSDGLYTAPSQLGDFHAVATSVIDPSKSATATVTGVAAGFRPTGSMSNGRSAHSATVLQGGKVLVAGGNACFFSGYYYYFGSCPLDSAEIYDPAFGAFSGVLGKMSTTRDLHTATLLPSGKVLLAGGPDASAELFDPTSGGFALTGNMSASRSGHTATLLNTGKVLVVGGNNVTGVLASAELYDPATGTFAPTGSLTTARTFHTATLLGNGKVLIVGGLGPQAQPTTAELYDPVTGTFSVTGSLATARANHAATLLDNGKVLVTGGSSNGGSSVTASAELYDASSGSFSAAGTMVSKRQSHVAVKLANGNVLLAGGSQGDFTAELYDPLAGTFTRTGSMATDRSLAAAVLLMDGRVLVAGGSDFGSADTYK